MDKKEWEGSRQGVDNKHNNHVNSPGLGSDCWGEKRFMEGGGDGKEGQGGTRRDKEDVWPSNEQWMSLLWCVALSCTAAPPQANR